MFRDACLDASLNVSECGFHVLGFILTLAAILRFKGWVELRSHRLLFFALRLTIKTTARNI